MTWFDRIVLTDGTHPEFAAWYREEVARRARVDQIHIKNGWAPPLAGQIYVVGRKTGGPLKVGYSYRPSARAKKLGGELLYQTDRSYRNAYDVERQAHELLRSVGKQPTEGAEWFAITPEEAREAIERAGQIVLAKADPLTASH
ncbi:MAG TPA: GIY-YIG nuclease family protein [Hyphomicrobiaceae bacterium]|jgi:hypothetical protein